MRNLQTQLSRYAAYHRDRRNIATHFVGIPMIVLATATLLSRPAFAVGALTVSPALFVTAGAIAFYFLLDVGYGVAMTALMGGSWWLAQRLATETTGVWLALGIGLFVAGWVIQFVGHWFEGRKPAFVDDLVGLLIGPLFIVAEAGFALGLRRDLHDAIVADVGPTRSRRPSSLAA